MGNASNRFYRVDLFGWAFLAVMPAVIVAAPAPLAAGEASRNLVVNPDFARTYAARRSPEPYPKNMPGLDKDAAMPCAWTVQPNRGAGGGGRRSEQFRRRQVEGQSASARRDRQVREHAAAAGRRGGSRGDLRLRRVDQGQRERVDSSHPPRRPLSGRTSAPRAARRRRTGRESSCR